MRTININKIGEKPPHAQYITLMSLLKLTEIYVNLQMKHAGVQL